MITSMQQAERIQQARVAAGKMGHARAVRRFLKRDLNIGSREKGGGTASDHEEYHSRKSVLSHLRIVKKGTS